MVYDRAVSSTSPPDKRAVSKRENDDDFAWLDVVAQLDLIDRGETSPEELIEAAIRRIEAINGELNAVIHPHFDTARERPGVSFLVKDVLATEAGQPYHCGLRAARDAGHIAGADSWLVERYRNAGLASLGRTNTPELATSATTEPLAHGPTRNPWDPTRTPGGSSGGSAAAVASGMTPAAHGNDMGGSIRIPAANCGLVGLKPSRARTSLGPDFGEYWGFFTHQHVLTRSVRDSAAILDATAGAGPGDPYTAPESFTGQSWLADVTTDPGQLRIGVRTRLPDGTTPHPEVVAAVDGAAGLVGSLATSSPMLSRPRSTTLDSARSCRSCSPRSSRATPSGGAPSSVAASSTSSSL
jgi:amidase